MKQVDLDYRGRRISIKNERIKDLIRKLDEGRFLIPTFQRTYVWDPGNIVDLWRSIYEFYPIGSILYWKTHTRLHVHRRLGGFYMPGDGDGVDAPRSYILDGQQRISSLHASFHGGAGKIRQKFDFDFTLYFNLKSAVFFFENEYYRHRWDVDGAFLIRLRDVPDLSSDYCRFLPGASPEIEKNLGQLKYMFSDYSIPLVCLEGFDIHSVCAVFERINQTGIKLDNLDIMIARSFDNCETVVEEDFPIK